MAHWCLPYSFLKTIQNVYLSHPNSPILVRLADVVDMAVMIVHNLYSALSSLMLGPDWRSPEDSMITPRIQAMVTVCPAGQRNICATKILSSLRWHPACLALVLIPHHSQVPDVRLKHVFIWSGHCLTLPSFQKAMCCVKEVKDSQRR